MVICILDDNANISVGSDINFMKVSYKKAQILYRLQTMEI